MPFCAGSAADAPIGTRVMLSMPMAMTASMLPDITACAAKCSDCCDEPHWRSTLVPGTCSGRRDAITALRATLIACWPTWLTQPQITSSIRLGSALLRSSRALITSAPMSTGCQSFSLPPRLPPAVRAAATIYASPMPRLLILPTVLLASLLMRCTSGQTRPFGCRSGSRACLNFDDTQPSHGYDSCERMNRLLTPTRRGVLTGIGATLVGSPNIVRAMTAPVWQNNPFSLGVASGAPATDGFVLWTKLAPEPLASDPRAIGDAPLIPTAYEIASDDSLRHVVRRGTALAERDFGYAVHANVRGLKPGRPYWYRFRSGGEVSAIGRAMTLPPRGTDSLRFAFFSCSHYEYGYFSAYRHAAEENPDFGIFLGDYIYEYADKRRPTVRTHSGGKECETLDEYRARYTQYRLDPDLQALHAAVPALVTWDDHEVQNDYADRFGQDFQDPQAFLMRRAAAYQAFYEFMPVKPVFSKPHGPDMRLYDRYDFGDLMRVDLIDGRQYRSREACYGDPAKKQGDGGGGHQETPAHCPELMDPTRSMIGMTQEAWLFDGLARSKARWNVIANDVLMARLHQKNPAGEDAYWTDGWDGYPPSRARLGG